MQTPTAESIAQALSKSRSISAFKYIACCPAHNDTSPSLHLTQRGDKVLFHCFAGCAQHDVLEALKAKGLWPKFTFRRQPEAHFSNEELLELFLFVNIFNNSRNRPDLTSPTQADFTAAKNAREVLNAYSFGVTQALETIAMLKGITHVR